MTTGAKRTLITGGLGFIGTSLARALLDLGHEVTLLDAVTAQVHGDAPDLRVPAGARLVRLDVREIGDAPDLLDGLDAVVHLAGETGTAQSMYLAGHYVDVNCGGTAALLDAIGRCDRRPRHVVLGSSRSVYGEGAYVRAGGNGELVVPPPRTPERLARGEWEPADERGHALLRVATPESLALAPGSVYGATKASQELLLRAASSALGFRLTILRLQNVYGEGQSLKNPYTGILSIFFNRAASGAEVPVYEDGKETRDFVHVADATRALVRALEADLPDGVVINIGSGRPVSVLEVAEALVAAAGFDAPVRVTGQYRAGDIRHGFADIAVARRLLGWAPEVSLHDGLARFAAWALAEARHEDALDRTTAELRRRGLAP